MSKPFLIILLILSCGIAAGCQDSSPNKSSNTENPTDATPSHIPENVKACYTCHADIVETFLDHGMAASLGPAGEVDTGQVSNPYTGAEYSLIKEGPNSILVGQTPNGLERRQKIVGRIGAGLFDTSWATAEIDPSTGAAINRLFFAPVESVTNHGLELSPFELRAGSAGMGLSLTSGCLTCHTDDALYDLPDSSGDTQDKVVHPANAIGVNAFENLNPISCESCHGDSRDHIGIMNGRLLDSGDRDIVDIASLERGFQVDVCARCHLQGDVRFELSDGVFQPGDLLSGSIVTTLPDKTNDDFRFVSQVDRMTESECFKESPDMTCTTCHDPHLSSFKQTLESFENTCIGCHQDLEPQHFGAETVESITGRSPRSEAACIDCHMRKSQPFDLPHIDTSDHYIRANIPMPSKPPHRSFIDSTAAVRIYGDDRLAKLINENGGAKWADGVRALALSSMGRNSEASKLFEKFPSPGSELATLPSSPDGLAAVESSVLFHSMRADALLSDNRTREALQALNDALKLAPNRSSLKEKRALLFLRLGDPRKAYLEAEAAVALNPNSEKTWNLMGSIAAQQGFYPEATNALVKSTQLWPLDPNVWGQLAQVYDQTGQARLANEARQRAELLTGGQ